MTSDSELAAYRALGNAVAFAYQMHKDIPSSSFDVASTILWSLQNDGFVVAPTSDAAA
jgi:hypothetical protein